jgi:hypothetical protein
MSSNKPSPPSHTSPIVSHPNRTGPKAGIPSSTMTPVRKKVEPDKGEGSNK